jgi:hypothetical protein
MDKVPSAKGSIYISMGQRPRTMEQGFAAAHMQWSKRMDLCIMRFRFS